MDAERTWECMENVWRVEADTVSALSRTVNKEALVAIAAAICGCRGKVVISGCGTSGVAARKAAHMLNCVETPCVFLSPSDALHGGLGILRTEDILILISNGGNSSEINDFIPQSKRVGAKLVAVTGKSESVLAKACDHLLLLETPQETKPFEMLATASIMRVIAVFDGICQSIALHKNFGSGEFSHIHPGGAVGKLLNG